MKTFSDLIGNLDAKAQARRARAIKDEAKQNVFIVSSNAGMGDCYITDVDDISNLIEGECEELKASELKDLQFTVRIKRMTKEQIAKLPEWEG